VHIWSYTARPEDVAAYGPVETADGRRFKVEVVRANAADVTARIDGITDRDQAALLTGHELFVARAALPETAEGEYYHHDLIGLRAVGVAGEELGRIAALEDFGAGTVLELERTDGKAFYLPFTAEVVRSVDLKAGRIVLDPPAELMDEAGAPESGGPEDEDGK
jgi:16S rRNA processing protein RimM